MLPKIRCQWAPASLCLVLATACGEGLGDSTLGLESQDCKILFIGNSLTYYNDQPGIVEQMATAAGKGVYVDQAMISGARLDHHVHSEATLAKIRDQAWDVVILEQAIMEVAFPDLHTGIHEPIEILRDAALSMNENAEVLYFMDLSMKNGLFWFGEYYSYEASQQMLYDGTMLLAEALDLPVAPVGWAWNAVIRDGPGLELFDSDNAHPSYLGSYLGAAVYFATIFRESAVGNSYHGAASDDVASYLQNVASKIVLDSLDRWRLAQVDRPCGEQ